MNGLFFLNSILLGIVILSQLGSFLGRGAVCSVIIVLFALPGMLYLLDGVIRRTTKGANFVKGA